MRKSPIHPSVKNTMYQQVLRKYGTCGTTAFSCESGDAPVKNWKGVGAIDFPVSTMSHKISDEEIIKYEKKKVFCPNCPIGCGGTTELTNGPYKLPRESRKVEYETEPTPGRHTISCHLWQEMLRLERIFPELKKMSSFSTAAEKYRYYGKSTLQAYNSKFTQVANCAGLCLFGGITGTIPLAEWINAATGWDYSPHDYLLTGERIETLRHSFNLREGITLKDTRLSDRAIGKPPLKKGSLGKITIDTDILVKEFYEKMFWDPETGKPS